MPPVTPSGMRRLLGRPEIVLLTVLALGLAGCENIRLIAQGGSASELDWGISIALPAPKPNSPQVEKSLPPPEDEEIKAEDVD